MRGSSPGASRRGHARHPPGLSRNRTALPIVTAPGPGRRIKDACIRGRHARCPPRDSRPSRPAPSTARPRMRSGPDRAEAGTRANRRTRLCGGRTLLAAARERVPGDSDCTASWAFAPTSSVGSTTPMRSISGHCASTRSIWRARISGRTLPAAWRIGARARGACRPGAPVPRGLRRAQRTDRSDLGQGIGAGALALASLRLEPPLGCAGPQPRRGSGCRPGHQPPGASPRGRPIGCAT